MKPRLVLLVLIALLRPALVQAHLGSPDVFYDGMVESWPAHITIRMPAVVPGRAEILVQVQSREPVTVSFVPISARTAVSNAPPAEFAEPMRGETNLFTGGLWLMITGAYSIEVRIHGQSGEGMVQIPVNSVATAQLPLPPWLGKILVALGLILFFGAMAIVAAAGESILPPGVLPGKIERRKYWIATVITGVILTLALVGGKKWWNAEEKNFRSRLHEGGWPDLASDVRVNGSQRILRLTLGKRVFANVDHLGLVPDHGKLLHLFLVGLPNHQAFGHIHPVRQGNTAFEVALPPLPEGDYELFCDLTLESGLSSTATNSIHLPPAPNSTDTTATNYLESDPDDSWAVDSAVAIRENSGNDTVCRLPDGTQVIWKAHLPLYAKQDAGLQFEVWNQSGQPASLEPYMGMMSHAAVLRSDGRVFAHLHPSGNYSMAAQMFFDAKLAKETGVAGNDGNMPGMPAMDHSMMGHATSPAGGSSSIISFPYEFPTPGDYRVWVQIKTDSRIMTAIFDTTIK